jgi:hypothetical protein
VRGSDPPHCRIILRAWGGSLSAPFPRGGLDGRGGVARCRGGPGLQASRPLCARCGPRPPVCVGRTLRDAPRGTLAFGRQSSRLVGLRHFPGGQEVLEFALDTSPSVVDGSDIVRSNIVAVARFWSVPLKAGGSPALASSIIRWWTSRAR